MRPSRPRWLTAALCATLVATTIVSTSPTPAVADPGPSHPLPSTTSTPVTEQSMAPHGENDDASQSAITGEQTEAPTPDGGGTPTATSLSPSATWDVSAQTGDFSWSYPFRVPPAPGGLEPELALSYASSQVDGRTSATNNQASWVGDGWDLSPGFVERTYGACAEDKEGGTTPPKVGDLCWRSDNATAAYPGGGGMLIRDDQTGEWRPKSDDGSRIERLTGAANGDNGGEYWRITTLDGTQYYFGSRASTTWTVPVFGDDAGEPCHDSTFATSHCTQAWRWNLDKVVDRHGNMMVYNYVTETNKYGLNDKDAAVSYDRGGYLESIDYGLRDGVAGTPTGKVTFEVAERCVPGSNCTPYANKANWPDVPLKSRCTDSTCDDRHSPTFFTTKRLSKVVARVRSGTTYPAVDSWTLKHIFPSSGDGEKPALWLKSVVHTGHVGDTDVTLPAVTFEGTKFANRVEKIDGIGPLNRYRITGVVSESGGVISITYATPNCSASSLPANAETNTRRCFPVRWQKQDQAERTDYFHKYVVDHVISTDRISSNIEQETRYEYLDGAAWHYDTSEFTPASKKSWNEFRGFGKVRIRTGRSDDVTGPVAMTEQRFYRGMHGDRANPDGGTKSVTVTDSEDNTRTDHDWLAGTELENATYDGVSGPVVTKTLSWPTWQGPTATRDSFKAYLVRPGTSRGYTALASGGWRETKTVTEYDSYGLPTEVNDSGDVSITADDRCARTSYARNTEKWLIAFPRRIEKIAVSCAGTPSFPADALSDVRISYDGQSAGTAPTTGNATKMEALNTRLASGPVYYTATTRSFDGHGRVRSETDAMGRTTTTTYTPSVGGPVTQVATSNELNHTTTVTLEPERGLPRSSVDPNSRLTEKAYDPLGRLVEVWQPNRVRANGDSSSARFSYLVRRDAPTVTTSSVLGPNGNYVTGKTLYDGLYRVRQKQVPAPGGGRLLVDTRYDSQGRVWKSTQPFFNDASVDNSLWVAADNEVAGMTVTSYDGAGRPVATSFKGEGAEKWRTSTEYGGDRVHVTPPAGGTATTTITDARGLTAELRQYTQPTPTGGFDATKYTYTPAGKVATVTNPAGTVWRYSYDLRGRQIRSEDPDKGTNTTSYDSLGRVDHVTDARGKTLAFTYDALARRTAEYAESTTGTKLAEWTYDTATRGKGAPASTTRWHNGQAYTSRIPAYTSLYKPTGTEIVIPEAEAQLAGTYQTRYTYNPDGSLASTLLPAAGGLPDETVLNAYDDAARPLATTGGLDGRTDIYVNDTLYTRYGEAQRVELGDPLLRNRAWLSAYYDDHTRQVTRTIVDAEVYRPMQADVRYGYDPAGNITSIADRTIDRPADVQCFRHDHLRRLTEAWTPSTDCATAPSTAGLAGPAPYWHSFTYDKAGNRKTEIQHSAAGDTTSTYTYPAPTAARPHAVTSVATSGPAGQSTASYSYDPAGNTATRTVGGAAQTLTWDHEGHLGSVAEAGQTTTSSVYTTSGNRLIRRDASGITAYLPGQELHLPAGSGQVRATRYYGHGGKTVAMRTATGLTWLAGDHQGTSQIAIDPSTWTITQRRQTPFGTNRGPTVTFPGQRGFVGGTNDPSTGLIHLGAREYDPALGSFISVDPIMDPADPQQMQGYSYANNSPITFSDPTGKLFSGIFGAIGLAIDIAMAAARAASSQATFVGVGQAGIQEARGQAHDWGALRRQANPTLMAVRTEHRVRVLLGPPGGGMGPYKSVPGVAIHMQMLDSGQVSECPAAPPGPRAEPSTRTRAQDEAYWAAQPAPAPRHLTAGEVLAEVTGAGPLVRGCFTDSSVGGCLGGLAGIVPIPVTKAGRLLVKSADEGKYVYRGVSKEHPGHPEASKGNAYPRNPNSPVTAAEHNGGNTDSAFTSWSHRLEEAQWWARRDGPGGVVMRWPAGPPPDGAAWRWEWSPDAFQEGEVLIRGPITGAQVIEP